MSQLSPKPYFKPPRRRPSAIAVIAVVLAALVLPAAAFVAFSAIRRVSQGGVTILYATPEAVPLSQVGAWQGTERVNILLLGIDQRPGEDPNATRADTLIVLTLDPASQSAGMLSIPRDLYVPIPGHGTNRINAAHALGGTKLAKQTIEFNFGIPIHHVARVNFDVVTKLVDLLGGIEVYNEQDIADPSYPDANYGYDPFYLKAGWHTLDGKTALKYARTRHGDSDFARMKRQQQVIMAARDKALRGGTLLRLLPQAPQILATLQQSINTDLSATQIMQLALVAKDVPPERIVRVSIDESATQYWTTPTGGSVVVPNRDKVRELRDALYSGVATSAPVSATPEPGRIAVLNGTQTPGLASSTRAYLQQKGFLVTQIGDAPQPAKQTVILAYRPRDTLLRQIATALGLPPTAIANPPAGTQTGDLDAVVILGDDFAMPR